MPARGPREPGGNGGADVLRRAVAPVRVPRGRRDRARGGPELRRQPAGGPGDERGDGGRDRRAHRRPAALADGLRAAAHPVRRHRRGGHRAHRPAEDQRREERAGRAARRPPRGLEPDPPARHRGRPRRVPGADDGAARGARLRSTGRAGPAVAADRALLRVRDPAVAIGTPDAGTGSGRAPAGAASGGRPDSRFPAEIPEGAPAAIHGPADVRPPGRPAADVERQGGPPGAARRLRSEPAGAGPGAPADRDREGARRHLERPA